MTVVRVLVEVEVVWMVVVAGVEVGVGNLGSYPGVTYPAEGRESTFHTAFAQRCKEVSGKSSFFVSASICLPEHLPLQIRSGHLNPQTPIVLVSQMLASVAFS